MQCRVEFCVYVREKEFFKLNLQGRHWFTKPYRFQEHNSTKHHLHTALCSPPPKQSLFLSPFIPPLPTSTYPTPFPSGYHHTVVCVYVLCICVRFTHTHTHRAIPSSTKVNILLNAQSSKLGRFIRNLPVSLTSSFTCHSFLRRKK